ncbi:DNA damage-binding protein 2 [Ixodes scapularis]
MAPRRKAAPKPDAVDQGRRRSSRTAGHGIANDPAPAAPAAKIKDLKKANAVARKKDTAESNAVTPGLPVRPTNLIQYLDGFMRRDKSTKQLLAEFKRQLLADNILKFEVKPPTAGLQFQQLARITCIEWHPSQPELCAFGSKTGEIVLWNSSAPDKRTGTPPMGNGGSVAAMKFLKGDAQRMYTATLLGRVMLQDFGGAQPQVFSDTNSHEVWFTALDVCYQQKLILAGDNVGKVYAFSPEGKVPLSLLFVSSLLADLPVESVPSEDSKVRDNLVPLVKSLVSDVRAREVKSLLDAQMYLEQLVNLAEVVGWCSLVLTVGSTIVRPTRNAVTRKGKKKKEAATDEVALKQFSVLLAEVEAVAADARSLVGDARVVLLAPLMATLSVEEEEPILPSTGDTAKDVHQRIEQSYEESLKELGALLDTKMKLLRSLH